MQSTIPSARNLRWFATTGTIAIAFFCCFGSASAQSSSVVTNQSSDSSEARLYRLLFHQSVTFNQLANEADERGVPKPHFRRILENRLELSERDAASLLRLSLAYQTEIEPIQREIDNSREVFLSNLRQGGKPPSEGARSRDELRELVNLEDAIAIKYRDLLQNDLDPHDFQKMVIKMHATFGLTLR